MRYALFPESHAAHEESMRRPLGQLYTPVPYPVPQVASMDVWPEDAPPMPSAALSLAEFAREHSWEVRTQYSRGHLPHAISGKPLGMRHLIGLRFGAHPLTPRQAYAVYSRPVSKATWTWDAIWIFGPDLPPFGQCGITELKEYLAEVAFAPERELTSWILGLRAWREDMAGVRAERAAEKRASGITKPKPEAS